MRARLRRGRSLAPSLGRAGWRARQWPRGDRATCRQGRDPPPRPLSDGLVSCWAKDAEFARLFGADATFDLSDHCDFDELIEVVERSGADQVYTVHGYTEDFARYLRKRGIRAWALEANEQLALAL